jgi:hypothetical protein
MVCMNGPPDTTQYRQSSYNSVSADFVREFANFEASAKETQSAAYYHPPRRELSDKSHEKPLGAILIEHSQGFGVRDVLDSRLRGNNMDAQCLSLEFVTSSPSSGGQIEHGLGDAIERDDFFDAAFIERGLGHTIDDTEASSCPTVRAPAFAASNPSARRRPSR